jgi:hypothetical protein
MLHSESRVATEKPAPYMKQSLARTRDAVGSHLERFGRRGSLSVSWS